MADECETTYGPIGLDGGRANEEWHGHYYLVQEEWSNAISGCSQGMPATPPLPLVQLGTASTYEGDTGTHTIELPVTLSKPASSTVTVKYQVGNGAGDTATPGTDFLAATGTLTFPPKSTVQQVPVTIKGDTTVENAESLTVSLTSATGANLGVASSHVFIYNDDPETGTQLTVSSAGIVEGNSVGTAGAANVVNIHVHLSVPVPAGKKVTVKYTVKGGSATGGSKAGPGIDFVQTTTPVTLTFLAGQSDKVVPVKVFADTTHENSETFLVTASNATNATIKIGTGIGTIINDD
jgi:hypothetical protein